MKKINLSNFDFCKKHKVDHTGTFCGECVETWRKKAKKFNQYKQFHDEVLKVLIPVIKKYKEKHGRKTNADRN